MVIGSSLDYLPYAELRCFDREIKKVTLDVCDLDPFWCYFTNGELLQQVLASAGSGRGWVWRNVSPLRDGERALSCSLSTAVCYPDVRRRWRRTHSPALAHIWPLTDYHSLCAVTGPYSAACSALTYIQDTHYINRRKRYTVYVCSLHVIDSLVIYHVCVFQSASP